MTFTILRASDCKNLGEKTFNSLEELLDYQRELDHPLIINNFDWITDENDHEVMCNNLLIYDDFIE